MLGRLLYCVSEQILFHVLTTGVDYNAETFICDIKIFDIFFHELYARKQYSAHLSSVWIIVIRIYVSYRLDRKMVRHYFGHQSIPATKYCYVDTVFGLHLEVVRVLV